jgi:hypothetical protein
MILGHLGKARVFDLASNVFLDDIHQASPQFSGDVGWELGHIAGRKVYVGEDERERR